MPGCEYYSYNKMFFLWRTRRDAAGTETPNGFYATLSAMQSRS